MASITQVLRTRVAALRQLRGSARNVQRAAQQQVSDVERLLERFRVSQNGGLPNRIPTLEDVSSMNSRYRLVIDAVGEYNSMIQMVTNLFNEPI